MRHRSAPVVLTALATVTWGRAGLAQQPSRADELLRSAPRAELRHVDSLYHRFDVAASLTAAELLAQADSTDREASWRVARAALVLGLLARKEEEQNVWYRRAERHAARVVARDSSEVEGLFWLAAARGRLALQQGPRTTAELAQQVWDLSHRVLALEPGHAGAHNILGKLNHEVMSLSRLERFLARLVLGDNDVLRTASWEQAEHHHLSATARDPGVVLYHYDLAQTYLRQGKQAEAAAELRTVLALPARYPPDPMWQAQARRRLARLEDAR